MSGRIHIPVGKRVRRVLSKGAIEVAIVAAVVVSLWAAALMAMCFDPDQANAQGFEITALQNFVRPPARILIANTKDGHYRTTLLVQNNATSPARLSITEPGCYPLPARTVAAFGAAVWNTAGDFCSEFVLADPGGFDVKSIVHFNDGRSESSFVAPPIGAVTPELPSNFIGPVINDGDINAYIAFVASERSAVTLTLYDGSRNQNAVETYDVPKGASLYTVRTRFAVGYISVALGFTQFGILPSRAPLYGFVTTATERNGNSIVYPFGE